MEIIITKGYLKDLRYLPQKVQLQADAALVKLRAAKTLSESGLDITKMESQKKDEKFYRIRIGDYRIGIENLTPKVIVIIICKRGEIYKVFP